MDVDAHPTQGSSPLTRGKRHFQALNNLGLRLIPAHAGKTACECPDADGGGAHPRSRGENDAPHDDVCSGTGSSPLTRGKRLSTDGMCSWTGLIPAHAGKTSRHASASSRFSAHPRSRGENFALDSRRRAQLGSSPLTRGKQVTDGQLARLHRLIPAHAGKTLHGPQARCGEAAPPRTRGKQGPGRPELAHARLIPAHAGKTWSCGPWGRERTAHPRSRGENPCR